MILHDLKRPKISIKVNLPSLKPKQTQKQCKICLTINHWIKIDHV